MADLLTYLSSAAFCAFFGLVAWVGIHKRETAHSCADHETFDCDECAYRCTVCGQRRHLLTALAA